MKLTDPTIINPINPNILSIKIDKLFLVLLGWLTLKHNILLRNLHPYYQIKSY